MVPAALLLLLVVVVQAAAVPATRAQARLHPSRPCQRTKQCSGVTARNAPKTENKGSASERAHKGSSTAASSRATESLQLQAAARPARSSRTFTHMPAKLRNSATMKPPVRGRRGPQQIKTGVHIPRRSGYWQPTGWDKRTSAKSMASTSFCGGLETMDRHCPSKKCSQAHSPAQAEAGGGSSWLRWDRNPVWAVPESTPEVVGLLGPPQASAGAARENRA